MMELIDELHKIHDPALAMKQPNEIFDPLIHLASVKSVNYTDEILAVFFLIIVFKDNLSSLLLLVPCLSSLK